MTSEVERISSELDERPGQGSTLLMLPEITPEVQLLLSLTR
jgi:hypothetical protein